MKKWQALNKTEKATTVFVSMLILASIFIGGYTVFENRQIKQEAEQVFRTNKHMLEGKGAIQTVLNSLIDNKGYLQKAITQKDISQVNNKLASNYHAVSAVKNKLDDKKALHSYENAYELDKRLIEKIWEKFFIQESINQMFEKKDDQVAIIGSKVDKELPIVKDIDEHKMESDQKELAELPNDDWKQAISSLIEIIKTQQLQMKEATELVEKLFEKGNPKTDISDENFEQAKSAVDKIKNDALRKELTNKLDKVKQVLDERLKKEEQAKTVEQKSNTTEPLANPNVSTQSKTEPHTSDQKQQPQNELSTQGNTSGGKNGSNAGTREGVATTPQTTSGQTAVGSGTQTQSNNYAATPAPTPKQSAPASSTPPASAPKTAPAPSKPYPLNPYHGNGILEPSEAAASDAADKLAASGNYNGYNVYVEYWSDGTEKVYLEMY